MDVCRGALNNENQAGVGPDLLRGVVTTAKFLPSLFSFREYEQKSSKVCLNHADFCVVRQLPKMKQRSN